MQRRPAHGLGSRRTRDEAGAPPAAPFFRPRAHSSSSTSELPCTRPAGPSPGFDPTLLDKLFFGSRLHEHADPAQRVLGVGALAPDSPVLVQMLAADPSADVRAAAAGRCGNPTALLASLQTEHEPRTRAAIASALANLLSGSTDATAVRAMLDAPECPDEVRAELVLRTQDDDRRRAAIDGIGNEDELVRIALDAEHASVRIAAAERVHSAEPLRATAEGLDRQGPRRRPAGARAARRHPPAHRERQRGRCAACGGRGPGGAAWSDRDGGRRTRPAVECAGAGRRRRATRALGRDRPEDEGTLRPRSRGAARAHALRAAARRLARVAGVRRRRSPDCPRCARRWPSCRSRRRARTMPTRSPGSTGPGSRSRSGSRRRRRWRRPRRW